MTRSSNRFSQRRERTAGVSPCEMSVKSPLSGTGEVCLGLVRDVPRVKGQRRRQPRAFAKSGGTACFSPRPDMGMGIFYFVILEKENIK